MKPLTFRLDQRPIPEAALRDEHSCELLRIWVAEQGLHCSIRHAHQQASPAGMEAVDWGVILAATVRHLARALQGSSTETEALVARIAQAFNEEIGDPVAVPGSPPTMLH